MRLTKRQMNLHRCSDIAAHPGQKSVTAGGTDDNLLAGVAFERDDKPSPQGLADIVHSLDVHDGRAGYPIEHFRIKVLLQTVQWTVYYVGLP